MTRFVANTAGQYKTLRDRCPVCVRTLAVPQVTAERYGSTWCWYWCARCLRGWWAAWRLEVFGAGGGVR